MFLIFNITEQISRGLWGLCKSLFCLIFWIEEVFNILAGLHQIPGSSKDTSDIVSDFIHSNPLAKIYGVMILIGFVVFILCLCWGLIKAIWNKNPNEAGKKVLENSFKALIYLIFIPVFIFFGLWIFSNLLKIISNTFNLQLTGTTVNYDLSSSEQWEVYQKSSIAQSIFLRSFRGEEPKNGIFTMNYDELNAIIIMDYSTGNFQYVVAIIVTCAMLFSLALAAIALCERIINIALLYLIAPIVVSTSPLDDGKRMETWRDLMLSKIIGILGNIMSMNIFLLLLGFISEAVNYNAFTSDQWQQQMVVNVLYFVISIAGSFVCFKGSQLIASVVSQAAGTQEGFSQMTSASLAKGSMAAVGAGLGKMKSLFGGSKNPVSQSNKQNLNAGGGNGGGNNGGGNSGGSGGEAGAGGAGGNGMNTFGSQIKNAAGGHGKVASNSAKKVGGAAGAVAFGAATLGAGAIAGGLMAMAAPMLVAGAALMGAKTAGRHMKGAVSKGIKSHKEQKGLAKSQLTKEGGLSSDKKTAKAQVKQRMQENKQMAKLQKDASKGDVNSSVQLQKMKDSRMEQQQNRLDNALVSQGVVKDKNEITDEMRMKYGNDEMKQWLSEKQQNSQMAQQNNNALNMPKAEASAPKQESKPKAEEQEQPKQPTNTEGGAM